MDPGTNLLPMYLLDTDPNSDLKDQWNSIRFQRLSGQPSFVQVLLLHKCYIPRVSSMQHSLYVRRCTLYNVILCSTSQKRGINTQMHILVHYLVIHIDLTREDFIIKVHRIFGIVQYTVQSTVLYCMAPSLLI